MNRIAVLSLLALSLSACDDGRPKPGPGPAPGGPDPVPGVQCDSNKLGSLIGKQRSPSVESEAMRRSGARSVRWLEPNSVATMDFRPDRLNLNIDAKGRIVSARCG